MNNIMDSAFDEYETIDAYSNMAGRHIKDCLNDSGVIHFELSFPKDMTMYSMCIIDKQSVNNYGISRGGFHGGRYIVGIENVGCYTFSGNGGLVGSYLSEKFRHNFGTNIENKLAEFLNDVF